MRPISQQFTSRRGHGRFFVTAALSPGAMVVLLTFALAPSLAIAQEGDPQSPAWQQRPAVQTTSYVSPSSPGTVPTTSWRNATGTTGQAPRYRSGQRTRATQISQAVMAEPVAAEGAPEEIYPEPAPETGNYGDADIQPVPPDGTPYGEGCGDSCGGYGGPCVGDGPCWGPGQFYDQGGCCPWLGLAPGRLWVRGEYLMWWTKGMELPPLLIDSATFNTTSQALIGDGVVDNSSRSGWRISFGLRPTECTPWGVEATYFQLGPQTDSFSEAGDGESITLARPFFNLQPETGDPRADAHVIANTSGLAGSLNVGVETRFDGVEVLFRRRLQDWCVAHLDFLAGWRYNRLADELNVYESIPDVGTGFVDFDGTTLEDNTRLTRLDQFKTTNVFNGGELGFVAEMQYCRWSMEALMKVAFGSTRSQVSVAGSTTRTIPSGETASLQRLNSGMLALTSNEGVFERNAFSMVPEFGVTVGYDLTCRLKATFGYSVIYWGQVARAGDQIDLDINPTQLGTLTGLARPNPPLVTTDFWAQGMNFGLEYRF